MKYYVYTYLNPEIMGIYQYFDHKFEYEPFYIGKGYGNRCFHHVSNDRRILNANTPFYSKIRELKSRNIVPEIRILKYFDIEEEAYNYETKLIKEIGSNYINEIKDGSLKNFCLLAQPPNHKGKTYEEIYGDRAEEQKRIRNEKQKLAGGFFRGHKHTEESKRNIGLKTIELHTGRKRSKQTKENISKSKLGKGIGSNNPNAKKYKFISPDKTEYHVIGEFENFCIEHHLSASTMSKAIREKRTVKSGKTKGWSGVILPN